MAANLQLSTPLVLRTVLGGVVATLVLTLMMYKGAPMMTGKAMDIAAELGAMMSLPWAMGMAAHFMLGTIVFPLAYILVVRPRLVGPSIVRGGYLGPCFMGAGHAGDESDDG